MDTKNKIIPAYCNQCSGNTKHDILHSEEILEDSLVDDDPDVVLEWGNRYDLIKCRGCDSISLMHKYWFSEDLDIIGDFPRPKIYTYFYPPRTFRKEPTWISELNHSGSVEQIKILLKEVYVALKNESFYLGTMGIRALIEHVMIDKIGDQGNFKKNLTLFEENGFISKIQREALEPVIEAGHASMHRLYKASVNDLMAIIDIIENILQSIYINKKRSEVFKDNIPPKR